MTHPTTEQRELLPCPFCGSRDVQLCGTSGAYVACVPCGAEGPFGDFTDGQAIAAWNTRAAIAKGEKA